MELTKYGFLSGLPLHPHYAHVVDRLHEQLTALLDQRRESQGRIDADPDLSRAGKTGRREELERKTREAVVAATAAAAKGLAERIERVEAALSAIDLGGATGPDAEAKRAETRRLLLELKPAQRRSALRLAAEAGDTETLAAVQLAPSIYRTLGRLPFDDLPALVASLRAARDPESAAQLDDARASLGTVLASVGRALGELGIHGDGRPTPLALEAVAPASAALKRVTGRGPLDPSPIDPGRALGDVLLKDFGPATPDPAPALVTDGVEAA